MLLPALPAAYVPRSRVTELLDRVAAGASVVQVTATAGSGKTSAVAAWARVHHDRPVAWLTCDESDTATGRLLGYVMAAVDEALPGAAATAREAMAGGVPHGEVAALLAEAVAPAGLVLVLDETERWDDDRAAWSIVSSFLRFAAPTTCLVLIGRREPPPEAFGGVSPRLRAVGDVQLALSADEAGAALAAHGAHGVDPAVAVELTGGWMTGVLFEAWQAEDHIGGTGGEADPLNGYLSSHILGQLAPEDRGFLVATSLLHDVTAERARCLGIEDAADRLAALRRARFPGTWAAGGTELRCHTRFRQYLLQLLERRDPASITALRRAYAALLEAEGHDEEAVEQHLAAGDPDAAVAPAARSVVAALERGDLDLATRWLDALLPVAAGVGPLTVAALMLAIAREDFGAATQLVDELERTGALETVTAAHPAATALVAWTYLHGARVEPFVRLMERADDTAVGDAMRYAARVVFDEAGDVGTPARTGSVFDAFILVGQYCLGRVSALAAEPLRGWTDVIASPWLLAAIRDTGQTQRALELYEAAMAQAPSAVLDVYVGPELLLDAAQPDRARRCADDGLRAAERSGSLGLVGLSLLSKVRLALVLDGDGDEADRLLDLMQARGVDGFAFIAETIEAWRGRVRLHQDDAPAARVLLERAVASMQRGDRILELPAAAVWLAEAAWRCEDEDAADRAADIALTAAERQGAHHLLAQELRRFPAVLARRLDAEADPDSRWFEVARVVRSDGAATHVRPGARLHVRELGERTIEIDGEVRHTGIAKAHEVLAVLAADDRRAIPRHELMALVFDGRGDRSTRTYLRQALSRLKQTLPEGLLDMSDDTVGVADGVQLTSDSGELLRGLAEAAALGGSEREAALRAHVARWERGPFFTGVRAEWADLRERVVVAAVTDAYDDLATLALSAGDFRASAAAARRALDGDPFRESAWRTLMRVHHALGDEPGVISVYTECRERFATLGTEPSSSTRRLLTDLRR